MRICKLGEEVLRQKCESVKPEEINDEMRALFNEMFETMISANGVGLAAPQVGIAKRFFVVISDDDVRRVFINPEITKTSAEVGEYEEGCLSIPGVYETIVRPKKVSISALNEFGKRFVIEDADGLLARVIQHENDHLNGIVFIDKGDPEFAKQAEQTMAKRAARYLEKQKAKEAKARKIEAKLLARGKK